MSARPPASALTSLAARGPCGLLLTETTGVIHWVNDTFCQWLGHASHDLVGKSVQSFLTVGGRIFHQTHWLPLMHLQGSVNEVFFDFVHADGSAVPIILNARACHSGDATWHDVAAFLARDRRSYERELLTARARTEALLGAQQAIQEATEATTQRMRFVLDAARLHLWETDAATGERIYEPGAAVLLGKPPTESLAHAEIIAALVEDAAATDTGSVASELAGGLRRRELLLKGVDGRIRTVLETSARRATEHGTRQVGVMQDISDGQQHRLAAERRATTAGTLLALTQHQLHDALQVIERSGELLALGAEHPPRTQLVAMVRAAAQRAARIIADLQDTTVDGVGRALAVRLDRINLHSVAERGIQEFRLLHPGRSVDHMREGDGALWGDFERLTQLLYNLLSNAAAGGESERTITVTSCTDGSRATLTVHDWGRPLAQEVIVALVSARDASIRFQDAREMTTASGLYIAREIAAGHGGDMTVSSHGRSGTTFIASFPTRIEPVVGALR